jgi:hypothetical protein
MILMHLASHTHNQLAELAREEALVKRNRLLSRLNPSPSSTSMSATGYAHTRNSASMLSAMPTRTLRPRLPLSMPNTTKRSRTSRRDTSRSSTTRYMRPTRLMLRKRWRRRRLLRASDGSARDVMASAVPSTRLMIGECLKKSKRGQCS